MASPLNGRVKRLEAGACADHSSAYILAPEVCKTTEDWLELHVGQDRNQVYELKPLRRRSFVRYCNNRGRTGGLAASIEEHRQRPPSGGSSTEVWVCSTHSEAHDLLGEMAERNAFSHALVFTDLENELHLGPGSHRIDQ
jgi:hypothetical protein